ncbi:helix-turn-helix domain-containing protein [Primorskyibacter aestuariivivens]|uniref:helix-turn-helix domain-containing protein n=1 Tax=Primorskyibacter aestuariivivens TaxID=1888912 RepID=UPI0022FFD7FC|nr:helix-turn-helix domain-containing protein [Primorskyibacter aestuariivivens]MDA7427899.1 helix-turn-helix domain-containing protein [Primorskyibacter aestuariivivens]
MMDADNQMAELRQALRDASELTAAADAALARASKALERALQQPLNGASIPRAPGPLPPPCEHRRLHRPGRPGKIATDPELQAFIRARADRMTYDQIAAAIRDAFPPERRVSRSTIHKWWSGQSSRPQTPS